MQLLITQKKLNNESLMEGRFCTGILHKFFILIITMVEIASSAANSIEDIVQVKNLHSNCCCIICTCFIIYLLYSVTIFFKCETCYQEQKKILCYLNIRLSASPLQWSSQSIFVFWFLFVFLCVCFFFFFRNKINFQT